MNSVQVNVLIACHNRKELTLQSLSGLFEQEPDNFKLRIIVYDDGSTDGTYEAVTKLHPDVTVIVGDGKAFWAKSMQLAELHAQSDNSKPSDYVLWLNDDVVLKRDAIRKALQLANSQAGAIVVGATQDPESGITTYSGFRRYGRHPLHLKKVDPDMTLSNVDTFNGNFTLIPKATARLLGGIDGSFSHSWADIDYGLRAKKIGVSILLMPEYVGTCAKNPNKSYKNLCHAWWDFTGPKGAGEPRSLARILSRHGGAFWPAYYLATYVLWLIKFTLKTLSIGRQRFR